MDIEDIDVNSILNKTQITENTLVANPYVGCQHACIYCYATFMIRFSGHTGQKWGSFIDIKHWRPLTDRKKSNLNGGNIMIGSVTDGYQPIERRAKRTQALLNEIKETTATIQILTKSSLVLRDIPIFKECKGKVAVGFSINTLDESFHRELDKASPISERIEALKTLHREGIYTYCFIAPIMPVVTDVKKIIQTLAPFVNEIWLDRLNLQSTTAKHNINEWLKHHEDIRHLYEEDSEEYYTNLKQDIKTYCRSKGYTFRQDIFTKFNCKKLTITCFYD